MTIAIDCETSLAGNREPIPRLVSLAIANDSGVRLLAGHDPAVREVVAGALATGAVFANAPFDLFVLWRALGPDLWPHIRAALEHGRVFDVLTREKLIDIRDGQHRKRGPYNLGAVAERRAGIKIDKSDPWRRRYGALIGREIRDWPDAALAYAQLDAWATWRTFQEQERQGARTFIDAARQARAHFALYAMTLRGVRTDRERVDALDRLLSARIVGLEHRLIAAGLAKYKHKHKRPSPVCRNKAAAQAAMAAWCTEPLLTDKGGIALSKKALEHARVPRGRWDGVLFSTPHPLDAYRELGSVRAGYSKNIPVLRHPVIRTRYDELVSSGRTSASGFKLVHAEDADDDDDDADLADFDCELEPGDEWVGTNTQNFGREGGWRECLIPPAGRLFGGTDYGALELVTFAQVQLDMFGRSALADLLRAGKDPHSAFAAEHILRIPYADFDKRRKDHNEARQLAKAWNFGKPGGMGEQRFIEWAWVTYGIAITPEQHRKIDALYHAAFPEVRMFWARIKSTMQSGQDEKGPIYTVTQPRSLRIRGGCRFPDAANTHFQGLGADVAKHAAWLLFCAGLDPASPMYGCEQVLFEHDAFVTALDAEAQLAEQERIMIAASRDVCPDVPMKVDSWIGERFRK